MKSRYKCKSVFNLFVVFVVSFSCTFVFLNIKTNYFFGNKTVADGYNLEGVTRRPEVLRKVTSPTGLRTSLLNRSENIVVPNVVHFVWFGRYRPFKFHHYLSVKSASMKIKPDILKFHHNFEPHGDLWKSIKNEINITLIKRDAPDRIYGKKLQKQEHMSDIARIDILREEGGIYMDTDVIALKSFEPLRHYDITMGLEYHGNPGRLNNGVIISKKNAPFLKIWKETYHNFSPMEWDYHDCVIPYNLQFEYPELIHVEEKTINYPSGPDRKLIYEQVYDWSNNYAIHLWYRLYGFQHGPGGIKQMNTTFGQIARFIYYNKTDIIK